jgi:hypothetical protein
VAREIFVEATYSTRNVRGFAWLLISTGFFLAMLTPVWSLDGKPLVSGWWVIVLWWFAGECLVGLFALRFVRQFISNRPERQRIDSHEIDVFEDLYRQKILWSQVEAIRPYRPLVARRYGLRIFHSRKAGASGDAIFRVDGGYSLEEAQEIVESIEQKIGARYPRIDFAAKPLIGGSVF